MWVFGQVWFACLVGFVVGVGLTWLWQVRPLSRRVADLETAGRSDRAAVRPGPQETRADFQPGFGNSSYDPGPPSEVGLISGGSGSSSGDLDGFFQHQDQEPAPVEPAHVEATQVGSVDEYVEALVQEYRGDAPVENKSWAGRTPEAVESWRPGALGSRLESTDQERTGYEYAGHTAYEEPESEPEAAPEGNQFEATQYQPNPFAAQQTTTFQAQSFTDEPPAGAPEPTRYVSSEFGGRGDADEQYLEYLRSGVSDAEPEPAADVVHPVDEEQLAAERGALSIGDGYGDETVDEPAHEVPAGAYQQDDYADHQQHQGHEQGHGEDAEQAFEQPEPEFQAFGQHDHDPAEVTSVLPFIDADTEPDVEAGPVEPEYAESAYAEPSGVAPVAAEPEQDESAYAEQAPVAPAHAQVAYDQDEQLEPEHAAAANAASGHEAAPGVAEQQDYFDSADPFTSVRPVSSGGGLIASAQPFQLDGPDRGDSRPRQGQLTPIEEGGFQPFAKPADPVPEEEYGAESAPQQQRPDQQRPDQQWQDDWTEADEHAQANGAHLAPAHLHADADSADAVDAFDGQDPAEQTGPVSAEVIRQAEQGYQAEPGYQDGEHGYQEYAAEAEEPAVDAVPEHTPIAPAGAAETTTVFSPITEHSPVPEHTTNGVAQNGYAVAEHEPIELEPAEHEAVETVDHAAAQDEQAEYQHSQPQSYGEDEYADDYVDDYADAQDQRAPMRSLFEPVIEPEQPTGYLAPVEPPQPQAPRHEPALSQQSLSQQGVSQQGLGQQGPGQQGSSQQAQPTAPHPIRVRTGVAQPARSGEGQPLPQRPVRAPAGSAGWQTGPFGPGSALPLPDGSAPAPQFRVKARTSSMVFHTESSPFYERLEPQVWFTSQEDAQRAGFTSWERPRTW